MKYFSILLIVFSLGCSQLSEKEIETNSISLSGEFLFSGPNTLQSSETMSLPPYVDELGIKSEDNIVEVHPASVIVSFNSAKDAANVESILLQIVSDDLEMTSIGTLSPLPAGESQVKLNVSPELDLLPYLGDPSTVVIADVNLKDDMDALTIDAKMNMNFKYKP